MEVEEVDEDVAAACNAMELGLSSLASLAVAGKGIRVPHVSLFKPRLTERPAVDTTAE